MQRKTAGQRSEPAGQHREHLRPNQAEVTSLPRSVTPTPPVSRRTDSNDVLPLRGALRIADAATYCSLPRTKLYELIKRGELRSFTVGRVRLCTLKELDRFLAECEEAEASA